MGEMCDYVFRYPRHNSSSAYHSLCANSVEPNCVFNMVKWIEFGIEYLLIKNKHRYFYESFDSFFRWRSRNRLGYIRKTNSFCTTASVGRGGVCVGRGNILDNGGSIFHGCENSDHPLIYDDANINFISQHCGGVSSNSNPADHRKTNISTSLMCPSASSTSNTYLMDLAVRDKTQVSTIISIIY